MNKFFRWYYQNKNKFWTIVLAIVGGYAILLLLNNYSANNNETYIKQNYTNPSTVESEYSVISGEYMDKSDIAQANKIIDKFISYCNNKEFINAYSLLSEDCKNEKFPTLEDFINNYCNEIFKTTKIYEMQNWKNKTYRIKLFDNPMETGIEGNGEFIEDYFTIVEKSGKILLSINDYS